MKRIKQKAKPLQEPITDADQCSLFPMPQPPKRRTEQNPKIKKARRRINPRRWWSDTS